MSRSRKTYSRRAAKRPGYLRPLAVAAVGTAVIITAAVISMKGKRQETSDMQYVQTAAEEQTQEEKEKTLPGLQAGFVDLTGLTVSQAEEKLKQAYDWSMIVSDGTEQVSVPDVTSAWIDQVIKDIKAGELPSGGVFEQDFASAEEVFRNFAEKLSGQWNKKPIDSQVESYDKVSGVYTYSKETYGRSLKQDELVQSMMEALRSGNLKEEVVAGFTDEAPSRTQKQAKEQYKVIGTFTTRTTENKNRNQNIRLAAEAIDGTVLKPGEEFSFNTATGNRTSEKGYQPAGAYKNGVLIEEPGGGVCQVSTTLYHAIIGSGFKTTERNAHSYAPTYVEFGQDAMVSFDGYAGPDLKFVNTGKAAVVIRASLSGRDLKMSIVGLPVLEEGVQVKIRSEKVRDVAAPEPVYEENSSLPAGTEKTVESGKDGSVWKSYRILMKNGEVLKEEPLHNSTYKAKTAVIQRNSSAVPETAPQETSPVQGGESSLPAEETPSVPVESPEHNTVPKSIPAPTAAPEVSENASPESKGPGVE